MIAQALSAGRHAIRHALLLNLTQVIGALYPHGQFYKVDGHHGRIENQGNGIARRVIRGESNQRKLVIVATIVFKAAGLGLFGVILLHKRLNRA